VKIANNTLGKIGLGCMTTGQVIVVVGLFAWTRSHAGAPWATQSLVVALAAGGAGLYFSGRILQALARRQQNREQS